MNKRRMKDVLSSPSTSKSFKRQCIVHKIHGGTSKEGLCKKQKGYFQAPPSARQNENAF